MEHIVAYQGEPGSYSEEALWRRFAGEGMRGLACPSFEAAVQAVVDGEAELAFLPVENTLTGPIQAAVDAAQGAGLEERRGFWSAIEHCIIGHPDAVLGEVHEVWSHKEALAQCQSILESLGVEAHEAADTAGAVREVKERGNNDEAAIASARAAAQHGMKVLARAVQDPGDNRTRFVLYGRRLS